MAMNGLERITERILSEANAEAEKLLAAAEEECARIRAEYEKKAADIRERLTDGAEREGTDMIARAKATAANNKRNLLLATRSKLIDEVFDGSRDWIRNLSPEKYTDVLVGLLCAALIEQVDAEQTSRTLYGEEDAMAPDTYEVVLNQRDRDAYGMNVINGARKKLTGKLTSETLSRVKLSQKAMPIDGGLILRCGNIESNCSLELLFAQLRGELEAEVSHALFDSEKRA